MIPLIQFKSNTTGNDSMELYSIWCTVWYSKNVQIPAIDPIRTWCIIVSKSSWCVLYCHGDPLFRGHVPHDTYNSIKECPWYAVPFSRGLSCIFLWHSHLRTRDNIRTNDRQLACARIHSAGTPSIRLLRFVLAATTYCSMRVNLLVSGMVLCKKLWFRCCSFGLCLFDLWHWRITKFLKFWESLMAGWRAALPQGPKILASLGRDREMIRSERSMTINDSPAHGHRMKNLDTVATILMTNDQILPSSISSNQKRNMCFHHQFHELTPAFTWQHTSVRAAQLYSESPEIAIPGPMTIFQAPEAMSAAANYAWVNRSSMTFLTRQAFAKAYKQQWNSLKWR